MTTSNVVIAEAYYTAMGKKDITSLAKYLHLNIQFQSPLGKMTGKEAVVESAKGFSAIIKSLTIRERFGSEDQAMLVYDLDCSSSVENIRVAALFSFQDGLISKIELFFDPRPFN